MSNNAYVSENGDASNLGRSEGTFLFFVPGWQARLEIVLGCFLREIVCGDSIQEVSGSRNQMPCK